MHCICLTVLLVGVCMDISAALPAATIAPDVTSNNTNRLEATSNCSLYPLYPVHDDLQQFLTSDAKLIEIDITLLNMKPTYLTDTLPDYYNPYLWVRSTGRQGQTLLILDDNYHFMSLSFLNFGVYRLNVTLADSPPHCLMSLTPEELLESIRRPILNDFKQEDNRSSSGNDHVCNVRVKDNDGFAEFVNVCCYKGPEGDIICKDLENDEWITTLMIFTYFIKIVFILFTPSFIARSLYRLHFAASEYTYRLEREHHILFVVTKNPRKYTKKEKVVKLSTVQDMILLKYLVDSSERDRVYQLTVDRAHLNIKEKEVLGEKNIPIGLEMIYKMLLQCQTYLWPFGGCCATGLFPSPKCWYRFVLVFGKFVLVLFFLSPWILRVWIFFTLESKPEAARRETAERRDLKYNNFKSINCSFISLVVIYLFFVMNFIWYSSMPKEVREDLKDLLKKSLCDVRELTVSSVWKSLVDPMFDLLKKCGVLALLMFPLCFVLWLCVMILYLFPATNFFFRLRNFITSKYFSSKCCRKEIYEIPDENNLPIDVTNVSSERRQQLKCKDKIIHIFFIMCLLSFWLVIWLMVVIIFFIVEMVLYIVMGFIVNSKIVLELITVVFMVVMYVRSTFNGVRDKYLAYHQQIHKQLLVSLKKEEIDALAKDLMVENLALRVHGTLTTSPEPDIRFIVESGIPYWQTSKLLLFLDKRDTYTPEKFFYDTICLDYCGAPGPLFVTFLAAVQSLVYVFLFLFFVFLVVMAFSDAYNLSLINQLVVFVAGGFVPFLFTGVLKSPNPPSLQTDSIQFWSQFRKAIDDYKQNWPVHDFTYTQVSEVDDTVAASINGENDLDKIIIDVSMEDSRTDGATEV